MIWKVFIIQRHLLPQSRPTAPSQYHGHTLEKPNEGSGLLHDPPGTTRLDQSGSFGYTQCVSSCFTLPTSYSLSEPSSPSLTFSPKMNDETLLKQQPFVKMATLAPTRVDETLQRFVKINGCSEHIDDTATANYWRGACQGSESVIDM
jgi:hypothetical protein